MRTAIYLRSSKDRHDVSLDAQRRDLAALAQQRSLRIVDEFADAVESGKDEDRDGFQRLIAAVRNPRRGWDTLLVLDTSRIARRRHLAIMFERECERCQVRLVYRSLPETDPVTEMLLKSILQAMDEWHSLTSRSKGLAGMRENVRQGFRAGGRAPYGYELQAIDTGAVRDGQPVRKSRLVPGAKADLVRAYLRGRAQGKTRASIALPGLNKSSLVGIEWNALTYAGHTVWNVHAEDGSGRKRRPRAQWVIQRDTHPALITDEDAEAILARLEAWAPSRSRRREAGYLLSGLLQTPEGIVFHGDSGHYRVRGRKLRADTIDSLVAAKVLQDLLSPGFVKTVTAAARASRAVDPTPEIRAGVQEIDSRLARLVGLVEQTSTPGPLLRQMEALEGDRQRLAEELAHAERTHAEALAMSRISELEVRRLLVEAAAMLQDAPPERMRETFSGLLARVVLDGDAVQVHYRVGRSGGGRLLERGSESMGGIRSDRRGDATLSHPIDVVRRYKIA